MRARRVLITTSFAIIGCATAIGASSAQVLQDPESAFVPGEIIVKFRPDTFTPAAVPAELQLQNTGRRTSAGEVILRVNLDSNAVGVARVRSRTMEVLSALRGQPNVAYAQLNFIFRHQALIGANTYFKTQWNLWSHGPNAGQSLGGMSATDAWAAGGANTRGVNVSVLDTGILENHEVFANSGNLFPGYDFITDPALGKDHDGRDPNPRDEGDGCTGRSPDIWHGTHVTGTLVATPGSRTDFSGVVHYARVQMLRVLSCEGVTSDIIDAIRWAVGLPVAELTNDHPARILNLSLGAPQPCSEAPALQAAINTAVDRGAIVIVAAGNASRELSRFQPAGCLNVIAVTAANSRGVLATYSNFGNGATVLGPGGDTRGNSGDPNEGILGPVKDGYARYSGTSMAAPHVTGVVAMWLARHTTWTRESVLVELKRTSVRRSRTECPKLCGFGLLSAHP
jgi:serine protease